MAWSHPDISLEDLTQLIKGYVDMLILASGYQSSGSIASWNSESIKMAVQWGLFFEQILKRMSDSNGYKDSVKELDAVLSDMTSDSYFPQGLKNLTSSTLFRGRELVLQHLFQTLPLRDAHLNALLMAIVEMDLEEYGNSNHYIAKLILQTKSLNLLQQKRSFINKSTISSLGDDACLNLEQFDISRTSLGNPSIDKKDDIVDNSCLIVQEILGRLAAVSCLSSTEVAMDYLSDIVQHICYVPPWKNLVEGLHCNDISILVEKNSSGILLWNQWRTKGLSYLMGKRTVRLLSGANFIFSAPKDQWIHILGNLKLSNEELVRLEIIELVLLGLISGRWKHLLEQLMSVSCDFPTLSEQYYGVHSLFLRSQFQQPKQVLVNSKEHSLLEYLTVSLGSQQQDVWKFPPMLVAAAIPSFSILSRLYLNEIERHLKGEHSSISFCSCNQEGKDHKSC